MDILSKHKKKGLSGFCEFVYYLELADKRRLNDIEIIMWLEDPVYSQYLLPNMINFDYFLNKIEPSDHEKIYNFLPNGPQTYTFAFKDTPEHNMMMEKLNSLIARKISYAEENVDKITHAQKEEARNMLLKKMRELQDKGEIAPFPWKLPSEKIIKGEHFIIPAKGPFELKYETGKLALEGHYQNKIRTGIWKHYHPTGKLYAEGQYTDGEKYGPWKFFDPEGKMIEEGQYRENLRAGKWQFFNKAGIPEIREYERGRFT